MTPCTPIKVGDEWFAATTANKSFLAGPFTSNSEAWRWIDRHQGEPISKAEQRGDWAFQKYAGGAP